MQVYGVALVVGVPWRRNDGCAARALVIAVGVRRHALMASLMTESACLSVKVSPCVCSEVLQWWRSTRPVLDMGHAMKVQDWGSVCIGCLSAGGLVSFWVVVVCASVGLRCAEPSPPSGWSE